MFNATIPVNGRVVVVVKHARFVPLRRIDSL